MDIRKICIGCMHEIEGKENLRFCANCGYDFANTRSEVHQLQPYTVLNEKYLIGKVIEQDNYAITYIGLDLSMERIVVVREFYPNGYVNRDTNTTRAVYANPQVNVADIENLKNNFAATAQNYIDMITENNTIYIVLEYANNGAAAINNQQVMQQGFANQQMMQHQDYTNQQMMQQQGFANQQMMQQQGFANQQMMQQQDYANQQMMQQQGFANQQMMQHQDYANQQMMQQQGFTNQPVTENVPKKKTGMKVAIIFLVLILIGAAAGAAVYFVKPEIVTELASNMGIKLGNDAKEDDDETTETAESDETSQENETTEEEAVVEETEVAESTTVEEGLSEEDLEKIAALSEQAAQDNSVANLKAVLDQYYTMSSELELPEDTITNIVDIYTQYQNGTIEHISMLNEQEVYPAMYIQMKLELEEAIELSKNYADSGIELDCKQLEIELESKGQDYKQRLVTNFDNLASEQIDTNGVISRSALWPLMERADETGLFDETNADDELRQRYITALTYHIDSELDGMDKDQAVAKIYEVLESTDYSPLLVYYLSNHGDENGKVWYTEINNILNNYGYNFDKMDLNEKRNFIFEYVSYTEARNEIRTYMSENFEGQQ